MDIENRIKQLLVDKLFVGGVEKITLTSHLEDDLGMDSFDVIEFEFHLEEEFEFDMPHETSPISTVGAAVDLASQFEGSLHR